MALDTLIVFGYGPVKAGGQLDIYARMSALAAGTLLAQGKIKQLLITGGRTGGETLPSEADLMASYLKRHFQVAEREVTLETQATDTIENLVLSANLLDAEERSEGRLGFLVLQLHGPRIEYLADLVSLSGKFISLESVLRGRSAHYQSLFEHLKTTPPHVNLAASQVRAMRGLKELPEFWLPPFARLSDARLCRLQQHPALAKLALPADLGEFRRALLVTRRCYPDPQPDDVQRGLEALYG